jgi:dGTPase
MKNFKILAAREENSIRIIDEQPHEIRGEFDRDRDRILYSKAFRRLSGKTQVFVVGNDDHIRTRLTHTLEVAQISNTISKYFGFDVSLTEAISLGHDIGHTPFGHVGERTLNYIMNGCCIIKDFNNNLPNSEKGFKHNWQGLRVVSELEQLQKEYFGLNLTDYTAWGILNHSNKVHKECNRRSKQNACNLLLNGQECKGEQLKGFKVDFYNKYNNVINEDSWTMEGLVVAIADEIAQRHHDIEDGIEAKILSKKDIIEEFEKCFIDYLSIKDKQLVKYIKDEKEKIYYLPTLSKLIVNFLTNRLIIDTTERLSEIVKQFSLTCEDDFYKCKKDIRSITGLDNIINYCADFKLKEKEFKRYLSSRILNSHKAQSMDGKADYIIRQLFKAYITNPQQLPDKTIITLYRNLLDKEHFENLEGKYSVESLTGLLRDRLEKDHFTSCEPYYKSILLRVICDYIAGMSDNYATKQYAMLYGSERII